MVVPFETEKLLGIQIQGLIGQISGLRGQILGLRGQISGLRGPGGADGWTDERTN